MSALRVQTLSLPHSHTLKKSYILENTFSEYIPENTGEEKWSFPYHFSQQSNRDRTHIFRPNRIQWVIWPLSYLKLPIITPILSFPGFSLIPNLGCVVLGAQFNSTFSNCSLVQSRTKDLTAMVIWITVECADQCASTIAETLC